jgi:hypothetical protein
VEHRREADPHAQAPAIGRDRAHRLRGSLKQEIVDDGLALVSMAAIRASSVNTTWK